MIPRRENLEFNPRLPEEAGFWLPSDQDVSEEGVGFFQDTWLIYDVQSDEAAGSLAIDRRLVELVGAFAESAEEYDKIATAIEHGDPEAIPESCRSRQGYQQILDEVAEDDFSPLEGLELGVSGVAHALSAAGFLPAASCRGHAAAKPWAENPVVYVATDRAHAERLAPLVGQSGCGFSLDPARGTFLVVEAPSALEMLDLGDAVLAQVDSFGGQAYQMGAEAREMYGY